MSDITANVVVSNPRPIFTESRTFRSVANGRIYIGQIDTDPVNPANQIPVYIENEDGSHVQIAQPLIINAAGKIVYQGQLVKIVTVTGHSMAIYDAYGSQVDYIANVLKYDPDQLRQELSNGGDGMGDALVAVKQPFTGSSVRTQHDKNAESISTDDAATVDIVLLSGSKNIKCLGKSYAISSPLTIPSGTYLDIVPGFSVTGATVTNNGTALRRATYSAGIPYSIGSIVIDSDGNEFICTSPSHGNDPLSTPDKWMALVVNSDITLSVPGSFSDINKAIYFVQKAIINAEVTVLCSSHTSPHVVINHPYGNKITIDGISRSTILNFEDEEGIWVDGPFKLSIKNITLTGSNWVSHGEYKKVTNGVFARAGAAISCTNVLCNKIYYGFQAGAGGFIYATNCEAAEGGDGGFFAFNGGHVEAQTCNSHDNYDNNSFGAILGYCFVAEDGSSMYLRDCAGSGSVGGLFANINSSIFAANTNLSSNGNGIVSQTGSAVEMAGGSSNNNISQNVYVSNASYTAVDTNHNGCQQGSGIVATGGSAVRSQRCTFNNNAQFGAVAALGSVIATTSSTTSTGNTSGAYSPAFGVSGNNLSIIADA
ncbi:phage head-binding domain-containing protein [Kluyvera ascorbata]|uniref:phage head-binding domain-containing protein n=1 Tax=Kluyvera ascorbata TaxID=51288 RepID=UPI00350F246C